MEQCPESVLRRYSVGKKDTVLSNAVELLGVTVVSRDH
jgi:hypothetical protein